jgi:hypothetical protein
VWATESEIASLIHTDQTTGLNRQDLSRGQRPQLDSFGRSLSVILVQLCCAFWSVGRIGKLRARARTGACKSKRGVGAAEPASFDCRRPTSCDASNKMTDVRLQIALRSGENQTDRLEPS